MSGIDLRDEPCLRATEATAASLSLERRTGFDAFIRTSGLSDNAARVVKTLKGDFFQAILEIADRMEAGQALSEAEDDLVYENLPDVVDLVLDLFNMVARRDMAIDAASTLLATLENTD